MPSQSLQREREQERRLNIRTLVIASAAAASAALVTSHFWFAGTWIAAALTPVIVAVVSEMLNRPTERIGRVLTSDRTAPFPPAEPPVRVYRAGNGSTRAPAARRKLALGAILATAGLAFVIAISVITVPELIAGQSIGHGDRGTTLLGGSSRKHKQSDSDKTSGQPTTTQTTPQTTTPTQTTPDEQTPTPTTPAPTTSTPTTPAPQAAPPPSTTPTTPTP